MSQDDDLLSILTYTPVDVCYTDLTFTYPWENKFKTCKWSEVKKHRAFDGVRDLADRIFDAMERHGTQCPTVTKDDNAICLTWSTELKVLKVLLRSGEPITYLRGHKTELFELDPIQVKSEEDFIDLLPVLAYFINPKKAYDGFQTD